MDQAVALEEMIDFRRRFAIQAYREIGSDRNGVDFEVPTVGWMADAPGRLKSDLERVFNNSAEWQECEAEVLAVTVAQAEGTNVSQEPERRDSKPNESAGTRPNLLTWEQVRDEFRRGAESYPDVTAYWVSSGDRWTLRDMRPGLLPRPADPAAIKQFSEAARAAIRRLGKSLVEQPAFVTWLDLLRSSKRDFGPIKQLPWREFKIAAEGGIPQRSGFPTGDGVIAHVFQVPADFCEDLTADEAAMTSADPSTHAELAGKVENSEHTLRRAYRPGIKAYMKAHNLGTNEMAARHLGVGSDTLKSIMSGKGKPRFSQETLEEVLKKIGFQRS